jgi:hypothetical protein
MENSQISIIDRSLDATIASFEKIKAVATYISQSDAFTKGFEIKDKDGNTVIDPETGKPKINIADVTLCLMAGHELGLDLAGSIMYGAKLNRFTYISVIKGRSLGIDLATSIEKIITIPNKTGNTSTYTMVDIITSKLNSNNVVFLPFIKNYAPFYQYYDANREELELDKVLDENDDLKPEYVLINLTGASDPKVAEEIKKTVAEAKTNGKIVVTKVQHGYYSKAKFVRTYPDGHVVTHYQRFSTLDAERAELLPLWQTQNNVVVKVQDGKDNWIKNTPQMMNNRVISIGGRIIANDLLQGIYTREEIVSAGLVNEKDAPVVDATAEVVG